MKETSTSGKSGTAILAPQLSNHILLQLSVSRAMGELVSWTWPLYELVSFGFILSKRRIKLRAPKMAVLPRHAGLLQMGGLMVALLFATPAYSLVVNTTTKGCSRQCESKHCQDPFRLRYGKYCGVGYTGCDGEAACDGLDNCCLNHDHCIGSDLGNYLNETCNDRLQRCVEQFHDAKLPQFDGSTCSSKDVEEVLIISMNVATLGTSPGNIIHLANLHRVGTLVWLCLVMLFHS